MNKFIKSYIKEGLYFHTDFTGSAAHTREDMDFTLEKIQKIIKKTKGEIK